VNGVYAHLEGQRHFRWRDFELRQLRARIVQVRELPELVSPQPGHGRSSCSAAAW
jgi:hypothetical protein